MRDAVGNRAAFASALSLLTLLTYFLFPGHTYLTQDSQIYVPILEHLWDSSVLSRDILVERPHVAFTIYDEVALSLHWVTHSGFREVLVAQQVLFRGLGLWGVFLIAVAVLRRQWPAILVTAIFALGAEVSGPAVLVTEYEPTPRAFAIPLIFLAVGLIAHRRPVWAGLAGSVAFLYHPPSVIPFWLVYTAMVLWDRARWREHLRGFAPLIAACFVLLAAAHWQAGMKESQEFFQRIQPNIEMLQRMRASYNWVGMWWAREWGQYFALSITAGLAMWRLKHRIQGELRLFLIGLPLVGLLSVPVSYILLDCLKWELMPQLQPARALLFVVAGAALASAMAGCAAAGQQRWWEAVAWFAIAYALPMHARVDTVPPMLQAVVALGLALLACAASVSRRLLPFAALAGFVAIPMLARARNYPQIDTPALHALSSWARHTTPRDAVFQFAGTPKSLEPGVFRSEALRAIYADWKGGGQVNYLKDLGEEWWRRYQSTLVRPLQEPDLARYENLGVDYIVTPRAAVLGRRAVFANDTYAVYATRP